MAQIIANKTVTTSASNLPAIEEISMEGLKMTIIAEKLNEVIGVLNTVANRPTRDRGPKSSRTMERVDAWRCRFGDLKGLSHKAAAEKMGLSYGQVYSARGLYTLKDVTEDEFTQVDEAEEKPDNGGLWDDDEGEEPTKDELEEITVEEPTDEELEKLIAEDES